MESRTEIVSVKLPNGREVQFEATATGGKEDVSFIDEALSFDKVTEAIEGIIDGLKETLGKARPDKASVRFGLKVGIADGQLTALVVKGKSEANLEITVEWLKQSN